VVVVDKISIYAFYTIICINIFLRGTVHT